MNAVAGWDVGGAHLKLAVIAAGHVQQTLQLPCPLWTGLDCLRQALAEARRVLPPDTARHAVTITGELVDLFPDRSTGVQRLLELLRAELAGELQVYAGPAGLLPVTDAAARPLKVASANWHASAALLALRGVNGVLVDVGSTTTDIVPVADGSVVYLGLSDHQRLASGELIYSGVLRTPVMALARSVPVGGVRIPLMAELFSTTADVYRLTGELPLETRPGADPWPAADDGPRDLEGSARRLLRMVGLDLDENGINAAETIAEQLREVQLRLMQRAVRRVGNATKGPLIAAGTGRFLVGPLAQRLGRECVSYERICEFTDSSELNLANFAPAVAVAWMAERNNHG